MVEDKERFAYSVFCDDVRVEANGKSIFVGVYGWKMLVPKLPHMLRLAIVSHCLTESDEPIKTLKYRVYKDAEILIEADFEDEVLRTSRTTSEELALFQDPTKSPANEQKPAPMGMFSITSSIQDVTIKHPCVIRVRFQTERGYVRAGALIISVAE
jgi:hypothetical protein